MCMDSVCVFSVCFGKEQKSNKYRLRNPLSSYSCNAELKIQLIAANVEVLLGERIGDKIALDNKNLFHLVLLCSYFSLLWSQGFIGKNAGSWRTTGPETGSIDTGHIQVVWQHSELWLCYHHRWWWWRPWIRERSRESLVQEVGLMWLVCSVLTEEENCST